MIGFLFDLYLIIPGERHYDLYAGMPVGINVIRIFLYEQPEIGRIRISYIFAETGENLGLYSIAIRTDAYRGYKGNYKILGWFEPGVFIYQLNISGKMEQEDTVLLTTTIEADVACDVDSVVLRQIDALTWEATLPPDGPDSYLFTAEAGVEHVYCYVNTPLK